MRELTLNKTLRASAPPREKFATGIFLLFLALSPARGDVTYQDAVRPLFLNSCLNCHNADKRKAGLDLSTYEATMDGSDNGKVVDTTDAEKSLLLKVLTHTEEPYMPQGGDKLPDSQIAIIRQWIEASAPEKAGGTVAKKNAAPAVSVVAVEQKPLGPPAMPRDGILEPVVHTRRAGAVPSIAASPWAPLVALAAQKQVLLYNTDTMRLLGVLPFPEGFPAIVRFSHNGSLLIAGGGIGAKLGHVVIWDVITGRRIAEVGDEFDTVLAADISPDQSLVALGGPSRLVKIFTAGDGKMVCKMKKHTDWVTAISFTQDGKQILSGDRAGGLEVWDCQGHELQGVSAHTAAITGIVCRGNLAATSSEDGTVKLWDLAEAKQLKSWQAHPGGVRSIAFTPDGRILTCGRDRLVRLWDASGTMVRQYSPLSDVAMQAVPAGGKIIAADWRGLVRVWTPEGKRVGDLDSNPPTIAQRIDAVNKLLALLQGRQAAALDASTRASGALAAARKQASAGAAIQQSQAEIARLAALAREAALASAADPLLDAGASSALALRAIAVQSLSARQTAGAAAVKSAQAALAAAQSTASKLAFQIKAANLDLLKWRTAADRLATDPQYASWKAATK